MKVFVTKLEGDMRLSPSKRNDKKSLSPYLIFAILAIPRLLAAQYSIIGDCDEGAHLIQLVS